MTRAERLLALVAELRVAAPAPLRARALAERLAVSERTVQRDIAALARSGLPVHNERGRPGGYALAPDDGRDAVLLSTGEAVAAAVALENLDPAVLPPAGHSALSKIHADLGDHRPGTEEIASVADPIRHTVAVAARDRRVLRIDYTGRSGERTRRDVEAHGLIVAPYGEYLVGWCRLRQAPRLFRVDRIAAAYLTSGEAGRRGLDELLAALRAPVRPAAVGGRPQARSREWALDRFQHVRLRLADTVAETRESGSGAAGLRLVLGHLAEWGRWQVAAIRAVATGGDLVLDGRRPSLPPEFDGELPFEVRERMIQDAMAPRSLGELIRDLNEVLDAAAHWCADCDVALWRDPVAEPGRPGRRRPLADLLAGWRSPLSHIEWHLDRLPLRPPSVEHCPLR